VAKAREFAERKEEEKEVEEKRKYDNRVKRAANALRKAKEQEEKDARAAARQLVADLKGAAGPAKKARKAHLKSVATTAKKDTPAVAKARKAPVKARLLPKSPVKRTVQSPIEEVVVLGVAARKTTTRTITLPQRFR
jgi:hypothetical protein